MFTDCQRTCGKVVFSGASSVILSGLSGSGGVEYPEGIGMGVGYPYPGVVGNQRGGRV